MQILVSAFEAFGDDELNAAQRAVAELPDQISGLQVRKIVVPTVFGDAERTLLTELQRDQPDAVLCVGQAAGRAAITPERVAINIDDADIPDNAGNRPVDEQIVATGPAAYFSALPIKAIVDAIVAAGVPAKVSDSAGTYVCNHLMYQLLHHVSSFDLGIPAGFIHVPQIPQQTSGNSLPLSDIVTGLTAAIEVIAGRLTTNDAH